MGRRKSSRRKSKSPEPTNPRLYEKIKGEIKRKVKAWPSAYASGMLVKEYKKKGGKYAGAKPSNSTGLTRWFDEKWINVCRLPKKVPCGRPNTNIRDWKKKYPYCRPSKKIAKGTPMIASELTTAQIRSRCKRKKSNPRKRVVGRSRSRRKTRRKRTTSKSMSARQSSRRKSPEYRWMSYRQAKRYIKDAKERNVSKIARSSSGFMGVYERKKTASMMKKAKFTQTQTWGTRRHNFIKRHYAQYKKKPSLPRWLALVMWAYKPPGPKPKEK